MYVSLDRAAPPVVGRVAPNVFALGAVSLVTDVSSELVTAVLPLFLVIGLGLTPLQFGLLDGLYGGVTALVRVAGGHAADRWQRRKFVAGLGYALSAAAKVGLLAGAAVGSTVAAGSAAVSWLGAALAVDRVGKGIRTAPRDALITLSVPAPMLGRAFGTHRAMDTAGALLGPLVAFGILAVAPGRYDAVFAVSTCAALLGLLLLGLFVRDHRTPLPIPVPTPSPPDTLAASPTSRRRGAGDGAALRRICAAAVVLGLWTVADSFVYLLSPVPPAYLPLLPLGTAGVYLLLAVPVGRVADRYGRRAVFLAGHLALLAAYLLLLGSGPVLGVLVLHGAFYAATDGVLMALAAPASTARRRTTALAYLQTGQAVARLASSVGFGALWTVYGAPPALVVASLGLLAATAAALALLPKEAT